MPTPVGPAPRDPNDPDLWDWGDDDDEDFVPTRDRHPVLAIVAAVVLVALVVTFVIAGL